jgi:two-component system chemotaxis response regulator CheY
MLVVDDFATMARIMKTLAHRIGFRDVDICHDGETALRMLSSRAYGFVLCDIKMHPLDGVEFAHRLRAEPLGRDCVILLTTADREAAAAVASAGILHLIDGLILKPFNSQDLDAMLRDIAARRISAASTGPFEPRPMPPAPRLHS